jgi:hypothetical protein
VNPASTASTDSASGNCETAQLRGYAVRYREDTTLFISVNRQLALAVENYVVVDDDFSGYDRRTTVAREEVWTAACGDGVTNAFRSARKSSRGCADAVEALAVRAGRAVVDQRVVADAVSWIAFSIGSALCVFASDAYALVSATGSTRAAVAAVSAVTAGLATPEERARA